MRGLVALSQDETDTLYRGFGPVENIDTGLSANRQELNRTDRKTGWRMVAFMERVEICGCSKNI